MAEQLPLRQMVLYKHGIGYYTRQGAVEGSEIELPFRAADVDDALKSLTVFTLGGSRVTGIHYTTPQDRDQALAEIPLSLRPRRALFDLLRDARGTTVTLTLLSGESTQGRVMGVEERGQGHEHRASVLLLTGRAEIEQVAIDQVLRIQLDEGTAHDLARYLDLSRPEDRRRSVRVSLDGPGEAQVSYTIPSPIWRVSYRLVGSRSDGGTEWEGLLQGWGIFDNRLDEDLEEVEVTLVAGQPVSFRYDLTSSVTPQRRYVRDEGRVAAGPIEYEAALPAAPAEVVAGPITRMQAAAAPMADVPAFAQRRASRVGSIADSTQLLATGQELDELFEYRLGRVSVGRGESAMIPVAQHTSGYRRDLLYNGRKHPQHPVVSLRLRNDTGLTLERGPVTVIEDGQYRGEAMLPFTKPGAEIVLAFAVELGVRVREERAQTVNLTGLELQGQYIHIEEHLEIETRYTLFNSTEQGQTVTIEHTRRPDASLARTSGPDEETAQEYRWRVEVPAGPRTAFTVTERVPIRREENLLDLDFAPLSSYLEQRFLDEETRRGLQAILTARQRIARIDAQLQRLRIEQEALGVKQDRLRRNLTIQASSEQEMEIRRRSADEFSRTQDRTEEIECSLGELQTEREAQESRLQSLLGALSPST